MSTLISILDSLHEVQDRLSEIPNGHSWLIEQGNTSITMLDIFKVDYELLCHRQELEHLIQIASHMLKMLTKEFGDLKAGTS
jgi:hypothetical protein